jgi:hypothetical protein
MALPTLTKTWEYDVNIGAITTNAEVLFQIKNRLVGGGATAWTTPWTVVSSSDSSTADNTDRWINSGDVVFHNPGSAHSWIVLQNDAISTGFQIVLEAIRNPGGGQDAWDMRISEAVGFTGGTTTNRPTASDEIDPVEGSGIMLLVNSNNLATEPANMHFWMSDDGEVTRWAIYSAGTLVHFVDIQKPQNTSPGWTIPWVATLAVQYYNSGSDTAQCTYAKLMRDVPPGRVYSRAGGLESVLYYTSEAYGNDSTNDRVIGRVQNYTHDLDDCFPMLPIGLFSETVGSRGRLGELVDMWWGAEIVTGGSHYPADATRQFVQLDDLIVPWNGGSQIITV